MLREQMRGQAGCAILGTEMLFASPLGRVRRSHGRETELFGRY